MKKYFYLSLIIFLSACIKETPVLSTSSGSAASQVSAQNVTKVNRDLGDPTPTDGECIRAWLDVITNRNSTEPQKVSAESTMYDCLGIGTVDLFPNLGGGSTGGPTQDLAQPPIYLLECSRMGSFDYLLSLLNLSETSPASETDAACLMLKKYNAAVINAIFYFGIRKDWCLLEKRNAIIYHAKNFAGFTQAEFSFFALYVDAIYREGFTINRAWHDKLYFQDWEMTWEDGTVSTFRGSSGQLAMMQIPTTL